MEKLALLLFVIGPLLAGGILANAVRLSDARGAAAAGATGGLLFGVILFVFGGFLYGPALGCVGGLLWYRLCRDEPISEEPLSPSELSSPSPNASLIPLAKGIWFESDSDR